MDAECSTALVRVAVEVPAKSALRSARMKGQHYSLLLIEMQNEPSASAMRLR